MWLHRDHIYPKSLGGSNDPSNIQLLCANCHEDKTAEDLQKYPDLRTLMSVGGRLGGLMRRGAKYPNRKRPGPMTDEQRAKISKTMTGRTYSPERRAAMSDGWRNRAAS